MFIRRNSFSQSFEFNKIFLEALREKLEKAGFNELTIKLPHNLVKSGNHEILYKDFLSRERNYPSIIVHAKNSSNGNLLKVLFVNISKKAFFMDDQFPSGHSEDPELFVSTTDPVQTWGLFEFFYTYLKKNAITHWSQSFFIYTMGMSIVVIELFSFANTGALLINNKFSFSVLYDCIVILAALYVVYKYSEHKGGVYIKERESKIRIMIKRAVKGELNDNPLVTFVVTLLASSIAGLILYFVSLP